VIERMNMTSTGMKSDRTRRAGRYLSRSVSALCIVCRAVYVIPYYFQSGEMYPSVRDDLLYIVLGNTPVQYILYGIAGALIVRAVYLLAGSNRHEMKHPLVAAILTGALLALAAAVLIHLCAIADATVYEFYNTEGTIF
jgi:hypothetical protein